MSSSKEVSQWFRKVIWLIPSDIHLLFTMLLSSDLSMTVLFSVKEGLSDTCWSYKTSKVKCPPNPTKVWWGKKITDLENDLRLSKTNFCASIFSYSLSHTHTLTWLHTLQKLLTRFYFAHSELAQAMPSNTHMYYLINLWVRCGHAGICHSVITKLKGVSQLTSHLMLSGRSSELLKSLEEFSFRLWKTTVHIFLITNDWRPLWTSETLLFLLHALLHLQACN